MAKQTVVNINASKVRAADSDFTELIPKKNVGPVPVMAANESLESDAVPVKQVQTVATWKVMDKFDTGLKNAVLDFIDTTKEGIKVVSTNKGRTKILDFYFYGTSIKSVKPSEIGTFSLAFSYPPGATSTTSSSNNTSSTSTIS